MFQERICAVSELEQSEKKNGRNCFHKIGHKCNQFLQSITNAISTLTCSLSSLIALLDES